MNYDLPKEVVLDGEIWEIRSDFRAILDICTALSDVELTEYEKAIITLTIFYTDFEELPENLYQEAIKKAFWFINGGEDAKEETHKPKLVDWEQDFKYIIAPINKVAGSEVRACDYLHWWTFLSYYNEIDGESTFAEIVRIRDKLRRREPLDKTERRWYRENRQLVDFKQKYTETEQNFINLWTKG